METKQSKRQRAIKMPWVSNDPVKPKRKPPVFLPKTFICIEEYWNDDESRIVHMGEIIIATRNPEKDHWMILTLETTEEDWE